MLKLECELLQFSMCPNRDIRPYNVTACPGRVACQTTGRWREHSFRMKVLIEFLGPSRLATGRKDLELDLSQDATFRGVVRTLGKQYPTLLENVIQSDGETLHPPNMLNVNARRMVHANEMEEHPNDGDHIIIMSISAGG